MIKRKKSIIHYSPYALRHGPWTPQEKRKEYQRLRKYVNQAQKRIKESPEWSWVQTYETRFPALSKIKSETELNAQLSAISQFLTTNKVNVTRLRQERQQMIDKYGDLGLTKKNYKQFIDWLHANEDKFEEARKAGYESDNIVKLFFESQRLGISFKSLNKQRRKGAETWMDYFLRSDANLKKLEKMKRKKGRWIDAEEYAKEIEKIKS